MTPERMRIRIAEYLDSFTGYYCPRCRECVGITKDGEHLVCGTAAYHDSPNYPKDLDACFQMASDLPKHLRGDFEAWLIDIVKVVSVPHAGLSTGDLFKLVNATAMQRCEAFLKTVELWEDEPSEQSPTRITVPPVAGRNAVQ